MCTINNALMSVFASLDNGNNAGFRTGPKPITFTKVRFGVEHGCVYLMTGIILPIKGCSSGEKVSLHL